MRNISCIPEATAIVICMISSVQEICQNVVNSSLWICEKFRSFPVLDIGKETDLSGQVRLEINLVDTVSSVPCNMSVVVLCATRK